MERILIYGLCYMWDCGRIMAVLPEAVAFYSKDF